MWTLVERPRRVSAATSTRGLQSSLNSGGRMTDSRRYQPKIVFFGLLCALLLLAACTSRPEEPKDVRRYPIEGKIVAVNQPTKEITLQHREIPGYMAAMT